MANNHPWKMESTKSFKKHIDPEMEERLKWTKIETEKKLKKSVKLVKSINQSKKGNAEKKAELRGIIEEISKEYNSMYDLYDSLASDARRLFAAEKEIGSFSSSSSSYSSAANSDMELQMAKAPETPMSLASREEKAKKSESSDSEDALLKDKLTSSSEIKKLQHTNYEETEPESGLVFKDIEIEDEQLLSLRGKLLERKQELELITKKHQAFAEQKTAEMKALEDKVNEMSAINEKQSEENSGLKAQIGELSELIEKLEQDKKVWQVEVENNKNFHEEGMREMENQTISARSQAYKLRVENERLYARIFVLETTVNKRESESSALREKAEVHDTELQNLREKVQSLLEEKTTLDHQLKQDQLKPLTDLENEVIQLKHENKKLENKLNDTKSNYQTAERKVEEMAEEFFKKCEDQLRILSRRIRVAEQLHVETKEHHSDLKQRMHQNNASLRNITAISTAASNTLSSLNAVAMKFENFESRISKASCELKFAKAWAMRKNKAMKHNGDDMKFLLSQLDDKEAEILKYREKVWRSENKARELEKMMNVKEEGMMALQEEKREAIRQLCVWIDYHRGRSDYYKKMAWEINVGATKKGR